MTSALLDPEQLTRDEKAVRDREVDEYDAHVATGGPTQQVADACVLDALDLSPADIVADVGTGTGRFLQPLLDRAGQVIGIDHSAASLELAGRRVASADRDRLELHAGDIRSLPLGDDSVDRVFCAHVLQHVPSSAYRAEAVAELRRIMRRDGELVLTTYRWHGHVRRHKEGFWDGGLYRYAFTARELGELLRDAGFRDVRLGGMAIAPKLAALFGLAPELQGRWMFTPLARHAAHYLIATARK
jgi:ubiquinone/menaquinone biosynthesis C-methylase UbiE